MPDDGPTDETTIQRAERLAKTVGDLFAAAGRPDSDVTYEKALGGTIGDLIVCALELAYQVDELSQRVAELEANQKAGGEGE